MENAVEHFEKAMASNSEFFLPYLNLGLFYLKGKEIEKAISVYQRVLDMDENNIPALLMLDSGGAKKLGTTGDASPSDVAAALRKVLGR